MNAADKPLVSPEDAAIALGVPQIWFRREVNRGAFPSLKAGRRRLVHLPTIREIVMEQATGVTPDPAERSAPYGYLGGKAEMVSKILELGGDHKYYCEPFFGSGAVLMNKPPSSRELANDAYCWVGYVVRTMQDPELCTRLAAQMESVIIHPGTLEEALGRVAMHESAMASGKGLSDGPYWVADDDLPNGGRQAIELAAADFLTAAWMGNKAELVGTKEFLTSVGYGKRYSTTGGSLAARVSSFRRSIPAWNKRLRGVEFFDEDGITLLDRLEDKDGWFAYLDPPYINEGGQYVHGWERLPMFGDNHDRLARVASGKRHTRIVVSYYAHDDLRDLYPESRGWKLIPASKAKNSANQGGASSPEVLIVNDGIVSTSAVVDGGRDKGE